MTVIITVSRSSWPATGRAWRRELLGSQPLGSHGAPQNGKTGRGHQQDDEDADAGHGRDVRPGDPHRRAEDPLQHGAERDPGRHGDPDPECDGERRREPDPNGACSGGVRELLEKEAPVRRVLFVLALALVLLIAPAAHAGGWATVGLSSTPAGTEPGTPWPVEITVLQHGVTPLEGVEPAVIITSGDARETFAATPTGKPGVYRAEVVFPTAGRWSYAVDDGFISERPHTFPAVQIDAETSAPAPATGGDGGPSAGWLVP